MKNLVFAALLCTGLAQLGTGCIFVADEGTDPVVDPGPGVTESAFHVSWTLLSGDANETAACPAGDIALEVVTVDAVKDPEGLDPWITVFDCVDSEGPTQLLPFGDYVVWVNLIANYDTEKRLLASSAAQAATLNTADHVVLPFEMSIDRGSFEVTWSLVDAANVQRTCEEAGAVNTTALVTLASDIAQETEFACTDYIGYTKALLLNTLYTISLQPLNVDGLALGPGTAVDASLTFGNQIEALEPFTLVLD